MNDREVELELENRRIIYEVIERYPGLHMRDIKRRTSLSLNLVRYHLGELERYGLIKEVETEGYKRYYPTKDEDFQLDKKEKDILALLRKKKPLKITLYLLKEQRATHNEIATELEMAHSTLSYHLKKLKDHDILIEENRLYRVSEPERIAELLTLYEPPDDIIDGFIDLWEDFSF